MARTGHMVFVGRRHLIERCRASLDAGLSLFLWGEHGVGKTTLARRLQTSAIYLPHCSPAKELLTSLLLECWRRGWWEPEVGDKDEDGLDEAATEKRVRRLNQKAATQAAITALQAGNGQPRQGSTGGSTNEVSGVVVVLDEFECAPAMAVRVVRQLAPFCRLVVCGTDAKTHQKPFLFGLEKIEVPRLSKAESEELGAKLLGEFAIPEAERPALLRHLVEEAQGLPRVMHELVSRCASRGEVSLRGVRGEEVHGHHTVDLTPALIIGVCFLLALRYAVRGLGDADLTALAGISAAAFMVLRFYAYRMGRPGKA